MVSIHDGNLNLLPALPEVILLDKSFPLPLNFVWNLEYRHDGMHSQKVSVLRKPTSASNKADYFSGAVLTENMSVSECGLECM